MDDRWARLRSIVERALDLPASEREAALDAACGDDADLLREAADWIAYALDDEPFLEPPARPIVPTAADVGDRVGPYRLTRVIADGGMGRVYEAERDAPRRRVALKVMRRGSGSPASAQRFRYEVEILAALRHPGIAHVYETGVLAADGEEAPWFAMEFVEDAETIVDHARRQGLSVDERVRLFARVCDAVGHGHHNGVIHRDLKPDNILVGRDGRPKVIDFGVARAMGTEIHARTIETRTGEIVGTVSYMSPEQLAGDSGAVGTRSDVFGLGVVLYELLCGELPHGSGPLDLLQTARRITETPPRRPSTLAREIRGDLETILLKCLEKDPDRRYASADGLGADLGRWLEREPIAARPPSILYTLTMLARRHRGAAIGFAVAVVALVAGAIVSVRFGLDAERRRQEAEADRRAAEMSAYVANIAAAEASLSARKIGEARDRLLRCDESQRSFEWHHLLRRSSQSRVTFVWDGHHAFSVAFHPDGDLIACSAMSNGVRSRLRILDQERIRLEVDLGPGPVRAVAFCPGEAALAVGRASGHVEIRSTATGDIVRILEGHAAPVRTLRFAGDRLVSGADDGTVIVLDPRTGDVLEERRLPAKVILADARTAVAVDGSVRTGGETFSLGEPIPAAASSPDGQRLAVARPDFSIRVIDLASRAVVASFAGHTGPVETLGFSADGARLVSGAQDSTVRQWDLATGREVATLLGHTTVVLGVAFSPDGESIASAAANGETKIWAAGPRETIPTLPTERAWTVGLDPAGRRVATGGIDGRLRLFDLVAQREIDSLAGEGGIHALSFGPRGEHLAIGREGGTLQVIEVATRREILRVPSGHGTVWAVAFAAKGATLLSAGDDGTIRTWDVAAGTWAGEWRGHGGRVRCLAVSPDGTRVASGDVEGAVRLWETASGLSLGELPRHGHKVVSLAYAPGGRRLATGAFDLEVRIFDLETREETASFPGTIVAGFSADGRRLLGVMGNVVWIHDVATGRPITTLRGHRKIIVGAAMSADRSTVASLSRDIASDRRSVMVWETRGGSRYVQPD